MASHFLTAEWRKLAMVNYAVDKKILYPYLPAKTEIDMWNDTCYVSLVGFMFINTRIKGFKIPFHANFEEVNLRFYVRHHDGKEWKRGVVFIKEIVPRPMLTWVANTVYKENYETLPMDHSWNVAANDIAVEYRWKKERWQSLKVVAGNVSSLVEPGSEAEFITEHYWGYTKIDREMSEYRVEHPKWHVFPVKRSAVDVDFGLIYGDTFTFLQQEQSKSVFLAEGSEIAVNASAKM